MMLKLRRFLVPTILVVGAALACDESPVVPPDTGSINLILLWASDSVRVTFAPAQAKRSDASADPTGVAGKKVSKRTAQKPGDDTRASGSQGTTALDAVRVTVTGPTSKTVTCTTVASGFIDCIVGGLKTGSYSVTVEGLISGETAYLGTTSSVNVTSGAPTTATVTVASIVPTLSDFSLTSTTNMTVTATWSAVTG